MRFSSKGAWVLLSLLVSGSSGPGRAVQPAAVPETRTAASPLAHVSGVLERDVRLGATALAAARPSSTMDLLLTIVLSGAVVALQLRRTQRSVRVARLAP